MRVIRTVLTLTIAAVLALLFAGCGPAQAARHASVKAGVTPTVTWGAMGDSITYGVGTTGVSPAFATPSPTAYPSQAGVAGRGFGGQCLVATTCFWSPLVSSVGTEAAFLAQTYGVNAIVFEIGINDLPQATTTAAGMEAGYDSIIAQAKAAGIRPVLSTITPRNSGLTAAQQALRVELNGWIRHRGPYVDYAKALGGNHLAAAYDSGDGLHPNDAGAVAMGQALSLWIARHDAGPVRATTPATFCVRSPCTGGGLR